MTIHIRNVGCLGNETFLDNCTKIKNSLSSGSSQLAATSVAGVDCLFDTPTDPPCIQRPVLYDSFGPECTNGSVRLQGGSSSDGRVEYCHNGYWSPFCKMDPMVAKVACMQLGFTQYSCKYMQQ